MGRRRALAHRRRKIPQPLGADGGGRAIDRGDRGGEEVHIADEGGDLAAVGDFIESGWGVDLQHLARRHHRASQGHASRVCRMPRDA